MKQPKHNPKTTHKVNLIKLSADVHKKDYKICRQIDGQSIQPAQTFSPEDSFKWAIEQSNHSERVVFCYEAGFSGFSLARRLKAKGVEPVVMCPQKLDERCKRVNTDRRDVRAIAGRLDRYLSGNTEALVAVRIPTETEEDERAETRQVGQLMKARKQFEAEGRSYLHYKGLKCPSGWWRGAEKGWAAVVKFQGWSPTVVQILKPYRRMALAADQEIQQLKAKIESHAQSHLPASMPAIPDGFGAFTMETLRREVCDYGRFQNRGNVGSFFGLVCAENSSGESRNQGSITKAGNPRGRYVLVELAWRVPNFQPDYWVVKKFKKRIDQTKPRSVQRKKLIIAMARLIAVDLWRLYTGLTTMEKLGLKANKAKVYVLKPA